MAAPGDVATDTSRKEGLGKLHGGVKASKIVSSFLGAWRSPAGSQVSKMPWKEAAEASSGRAPGRASQLSSLAAYLHS